ncbi:hypothetical protein [Antarctobacter sp.]|uniref:hypothetical protein n=1 Tax=Antarctobacter sp. TaxID=1872577 RepID=UPI003A959497
MTLDPSQNETWRRDSGGMVSRARGLRARLLDIAVPQRFVFHHVPKCGGTSVARALRKRCILSQATVHPEASFRAFEAFTGRHDRDAMLVDVLDLREQMLLYLMYTDTRCIAAHVGFSETAFARFAGHYKFVTVLREPVARFLSHFAWSHGRHGAHAMIAEPFDAFLETPRAARMGASYVEYFSGLPDRHDLRSAAAIDRAVKGLHRFDVVGRLDDLARFRTDLKREIGLRPRIGHENRARGPRAGLRPADLTPEQLDRVRALCTPDLAVWDAAP